ncbi:MAG: adenine phosphoribosyltransferase [Pseudomonadota bacterium]
MKLQDYIRTIPDYPKPGILFRDVTTLMANKDAFAATIERLAEPHTNSRISHVAGIDARGFILGGALARRLDAGFIALRKPGKLPYETLSERYELEYGTDELHLHVDALKAGDRVLLVDDLIATGGTAAAGASLVERSGANLIAATFLVDLPDLGGSARLRDQGISVTVLIDFPGH